MNPLRWLPRWLLEPTSRLSANLDLKAISSGRILNTDLTSRIFHAKTYKKSGLRADGVEIPRRASGDACPQRQGRGGRLRNPCPAFGQDSAAVDQGGAFAVSCRHEWRGCAVARCASNLSLRGDPRHRWAVVHHILLQRRKGLRPDSKLHY